MASGQEDPYAEALRKIGEVFSSEELALAGAYSRLEELLLNPHHIRRNRGGMSVRAHGVDDYIDGRETALLTRPLTALETNGISASRLREELSGMGVVDAHNDTNRRMSLVPETIAAFYEKLATSGLPQKYAAFKETLPPEQQEALSSGRRGK